MKKGFTLIELLAVLVILGLIGMIAIPTITSSIKTYKNKLLETQYANIEAAAKAWGAKNINLLPQAADTSIVKTLEEAKTTEVKYGVLVLTLKDLQTAGLIGTNLMNPVTRKEIDPNLEIRVINMGNKYIYQVVK